jgi:hypothetical protein
MPVHLGSLVFAGPDSSGHAEPTVNRDRDVWIRLASIKPGVPISRSKTSIYTR